MSQVSWGNPLLQVRRQKQGLVRLDIWCDRKQRDKPYAGLDGEAQDQGQGRGAEGEAAEGQDLGAAAAEGAAAGAAKRHHLGGRRPTAWKIVVGGTLAPAVPAQRTSTFTAL